MIEGSGEGPVLVIGSGLIGSSVGLAMRRAGVVVALEDSDQVVLAEAVRCRAGVARTDKDLDPQLVVVSVPPSVAGEVVASSLRRFPQATVTDTTSVKGVVVRDIERRGEDLSRFVGGHPMAGRETSGPLGARADLFDDRVWLLTPSGRENPKHVERVRWLAESCGATVRQLGPDEHDSAVALVSHAPQVLASTLAASLVGEPEDHVNIAGSGLADVIRIAASNPDLWGQILVANAGAVARCLNKVVDRLESVQAEFERLAAAGPAAGGGHVDAPVLELLRDGQQGYARLPGKHGESRMSFAVVSVMVADEPGELARLFVAAGDLSVNLEDVRIEHILGRPSGLVDLYVNPESSSILTEGLTASGFDVRS